MTDEIRKLLPVALKDYKDTIEAIRLLSYDEAYFYCCQNRFKHGLCYYFILKYNICLTMNMFPKGLLINGTWYANPVSNATSKNELFALLSKRIELIKILMTL